MFPCADGLVLYHCKKLSRTHFCHNGGIFSGPWLSGKHRGGLPNDNARRDPWLATIHFNDRRHYCCSRNALLFDSTGSSKNNNYTEGQVIKTTMPIDPYNSVILVFFGIMLIGLTIYLFSQDRTD